MLGGEVAGGCFTVTPPDVCSAMSDSGQVVGGGALTGTAVGGALLGAASKSGCGASAAAARYAGSEAGGSFAGADSLLCEVDRPAAISG